MLQAVLASSCLYTGRERQTHQTRVPVSVVYALSYAGEGEEKKATEEVAGPEREEDKSLEREEKKERKASGNKTEEEDRQVVTVV